ncbi:MAG: cache domain-containing protein, partial [Actinomycetota bacterium]
MGPGTRLIAIALPVLAALCALGALFSVRSYQDQRDRVRDSTRALAVAAAANADRYLQERLQLLTAVAAQGPFATGDAAGIGDVLARVRPAARDFSGAMGWIDAGGTLRAGPGGAATALDLRDRRYVREVLRTGGPYVSEGVVSRATAAPVVVLAVPTHAADGHVNGVLTAGIRLDRVGAAQEALRFEQASVRIADRDGNVILGPGPIRLLTTVADPPLLAEMRATRRGVLDGPAGLQDGRGRLVGYASAPTGRWLVLVDRSAGDALAAPRRTLVVELSALAVAALIGGIGSALFARRLNRATLRDERARRRAELLRRAAGDLLGDLDEHTIGRRIYEVARAELASTGMTLATRDPSGREHLLAFGAPAGTLPGGAQDAAPASGPFVLRGDELRGVIPPDAGAPKAVIGVALEAEGRRVGWLLTRWEAGGAPDGDDLGFASLLGLTAAQAFERARLLREERTARMRVQALQRITATLSAAATSGDIFAGVAAAAGEAVGARFCSVAVLAPDGRTLRVVSRHGDNPGRPATVDLHGRDPMAIVVRSRRPVFEAGPAGEGDPSRLREEGARRATLPLLDAERAFGAMLLHFDGPRAFDAGEVGHLAGVARHIAQALVRASYLDAERVARSRAEVLQGVGVRLAGAAGTAAVAEIAVRHGLAALGARAGALHLEQETGRGAMRRLP